MTAPHLVFLQGMPSPFFRRVGRQLARNQQCRVTRINFCAGDWLFWSGGDCVSYRGSYKEWPKFIDSFFNQQGVTDLVLLGEQRRYHKEAVFLAQQLGIRVTVNDFGYLRPDWITLERDGMSGNSRFPKKSDEIIERASRFSPPDLTRLYRDSSFRMVMGDLLYNFSNLFFWFSFPRYRRSDCRPHTLPYTVGSAKHLLGAAIGRSNHQRKIENFTRSSARYFVLPLQLDHDFQVIAYSQFSGMEEVIRLVISSFAKFSAVETRLIIKVHPWDCRFVSWGKLVRKVSEEHSIVDRVDFLGGGSLDEVVNCALGMVTVNSTSGLHALQMNCPVKVLGKAVYDVPGLTYQGSLDAFWHSDQLPDSALLDAFIKLMVHEYQIRGVFFSEPGCTAAVDAAVQRLEAGFTSRS